MGFRDDARTVLVIASLVTALYIGAGTLTWALRLPGDMSLPIVVRSLGAALIVEGAAIVAWLLRHRPARDILTSTGETVLKLLRRRPLAAMGGRTESLVVLGPYRLVRHPMYSGVGSMALGIGLLADRTWAFAGALGLCVWFAAVLAPFEERELRLLFGTAYEAYVRATPRFLPVPRRRR